MILLLLFINKQFIWESGSVDMTTAEFVKVAAVIVQNTYKLWINAKEKCAQNDQINMCRGLGIE